MSVALEIFEALNDRLTQTGEKIPTRLR